MQTRRASCGLEETRSLVAARRTIDLARGRSSGPRCWRVAGGPVPAWDRGRSLSLLRGELCRRDSGRIEDARPRANKSSSRRSDISCVPPSCRAGWAFWYSYSSRWPFRRIDLAKIRLALPCGGSDQRSSSSEQSTHALGQDLSVSHTLPATERTLRYLEAQKNRRGGPSRLPTTSA